MAYDSDTAVEATSTEDETAEKSAPKPTEKLLKRLLLQYKRAAEAIAEQAKNEEEDLEFQVPEKQWDEAAKRERQGFAVAGVPSPPRPCLSVSKIQQPIDQILNQERSAHLGVNIHPLSPDADEDTAEIQQGLYRRIERSQPPAQTARSWAYTRAVETGRGFYRVATEYEDLVKDPKDPAFFDQCIVIRRIKYQAQVYFDPASIQPDQSDANHCYVTGWVSKREFEKRWPNAEFPDGEGELGPAGVALDIPEWVRGEEDQQECLVAEGWYKETEYETVTSPDDETVSRDREVTTLYYCKFTANEFLEGPTPEQGKYIPIVPVIGRELQPIKGKSLWQGLIRPARDGQRVFNFAISGLVEKAALEPKAPFLLDPRQIQGFEAQWQQANTRNMAFLPYKSMPDASGQPMAPPARVQVSAEGMGPLMMLVQESNSWIQSTMSQYDPSLGRSNPNERSGKAIMALQQQGEQSNSNFLYNLADISMRYEALVVLDMMPYVYDRPGRIVQIMDAEDATEAVMLNQPYFEHPSLGPTPIGPDPLTNQMPERMGVRGQQGTYPVKHYDLSKGLYGSSVSIGKSSQSKMQEGAEELGQIIQSVPNLLPIIGPLYFKYRDFPGAQEVSDLLKRMRDMQYPALAKGQEGEPPTPEQAQAQIQQLTQQLQQAHGQLQQAGQVIQTKQVEQQGKMAQVQATNQSKEKIAAAKNQNDLVIEKMNEMTQLIKSMMDHKHEAIQSTADRATEAALAGAQQEHERAMPAMQAAAAPPPIAPFSGSTTQPISGESEL